ncbi:hypothetical protein BLNAU_13289 [Blattamonas nauphoetae]|uniref:Uncharacterized protein n=1 Tax=Blattamonas nauphoetae TaxID=2049346 RepID=A0ABQ9XID4_9EUKA|nr:hypothetical protein BLNAU_13289 [Blattamonas nauphoetae]
MPSPLDQRSIASHTAVVFVLFSASPTSFFDVVVFLFSCHLLALFIFSSETPLSTSPHPGSFASTRSRVTNRFDVLIPVTTSSMETHSPLFVPSTSGHRVSLSVPCPQKSNRESCHTTISPASPTHVIQATLMVHWPHVA